MRDGTRLATDIHFPSDGQDAGPYPALVVRTPYTRELPLAIDAALRFVEAGYVVVIQDVRGRGDSEGEWRPLFNEGPDGYDAIEWAATQPWCDGNVGTTGASYPGYVQCQAAPDR